MHIHAFDGNIAAVTDGSSMPGCFNASKQTLRQIINKLCIGRWTWFLSHFDYDHYSLTLALIKQGRWPVPRYVVLPASYSYDACREAVAEYLALAYLIADRLKLILYPPSTMDLYKELSRFIGQRSIIYGVAAGDQIVLNGVVYHVIWPDKQYVKEKYNELINVIMRKIDEVCKGNKKCKEDAENIMKRIKSTLNGLGVKSTESRVSRFL